MTSRVKFIRGDFRTIDGVPLEVRGVIPERAGDLRLPAFAYFHPGAWKAGGPGDHFGRALRYLATRGVFGASFAYRLLPNGRKSDGQHGVRFGAARSKLDCVADAQAAIRWLRERPEVDPTRVVAGGYSAGAHLAAATALLAPVEPAEGSCEPNALVLFAGVYEGEPEVAPLAHVRTGVPPALVAFGVKDPLAAQGRRFAHALVEAGNRCEVAEFPGAHDTFASHPLNPVYAAALARTDEFLVSLGWLEPAPDAADRIANIDADIPARKHPPAKTLL